MLGVRVELPDEALRVSGVSIDTRVLEDGDLFVALPGNRVDGHVFLDEAFKKGAAGAIVDRKHFFSERENMARFRNILTVEDPVRALQMLANWHRMKFQLRAIGITGSVGKTTTKEFLNYVLSRKYSVLATQGNLNNHLGLPLTLFRLRSGHRFCVAEMGANHLGEIRQLANILKPDAALITKICPAHLEGFGSLQAIYQAKTEIYEPLRKGSTVVIPDDDETLFAKAHRMDLKVVTVGFSEGADYQINVIDQKEGQVRFVLNERKQFSFRSRASFLARNAAYAVAMAEQFGISMEDLPESWDDLHLPQGRFEEIPMSNGIRVIFDGYNANPASFENAVDSFCMMPLEGRRMMVFSDMLELGADSAKYHDALGRHLASSSLHFVVAYGPMAKLSIEAIRKTNSSLPAEHFENARDAAMALQEKLEPGDGVLLKASRGMKVEEVLGCLKANLKLRDSQVRQTTVAG
jgi:UDP-N-acetylmuramoyl-tripeptide--D-alanyl-D-alanine ligase